MLYRRIPIETTLTQILVYLVGTGVILTLVFSLLLTVVINYTRLKKERDFTTSILQTAGVLILVLDKKGYIQEFNKSCEVTTGYTRKEVIGQSIQTLPFSNCKDFSKHSFFEMLNNKKRFRHFELCWINRNGTKHNISWANTYLKDTTNKDKWIICTGIDITEKRKLEQEFLKVKKMESVGLLAGGIAHDFNNILTAILGNISLAKLELESDHDLVEILSQAEHASIQARNLTNQLLTFSKGGLPVLEPGSVVELVVETTNFALRGSNIKPTFDIDNDLWSTQIDQVQIHQVINNLIINAAQAMPEGGILEIGLHNQIIDRNSIDRLPSGNYIKIIIRDHGIGIPEEHLLKIFDPYFTTKKRGHGLGLATTYSIIKNHKGLITVDSTIGEGTTFTIHLPATAEQKERIEQHHNTPLSGKGRILVIDDEVFIRNLTRRLLTRLGYEVELAGNGEEAIELYEKARSRQCPFDAVIVDLTIKGHKGGKEAVTRLHKIDPNLPAIVSSGYSNDPIMAHYKEHGFIGVVMKPYKIEDLSYTLHEALKSKDISSS